MGAYFRGLVARSLFMAVGLYVLVCSGPVWAEAQFRDDEGSVEGLRVMELTDGDNPGVLPVYVVKADPRRFRLKLLSASEHGGGPRSLRRWSEEFGLYVAINASMYQEENMERSTGFMKNFDHLNNPTINPGYGAFMVFNPKESSLPHVRFVDRRRQPDWKSTIEKYHSVIQNYRMISDGEQTGWPPDGKAHSTAALGMDHDGNVLFIFSSMPRTNHDLIGLLLRLPLGIRDLMYAEGGSYAGMYCGDALRESGSAAGLEHLPSLKVPNVLGIVPR